MVGIIEETAKLITVIFFCRTIKPKYILNGLLIGAAVGAGFGVFETAGYAFQNMLGGVQNGMIIINWDTMMQVLFIRVTIALGGHVMWTALAGAAYVSVSQGRPFDFSYLANGAFLRIFIVSVVLHAVWDMPIDLKTDIPIVQMVLIILVWIVALVLINKGLQQISVVSAEYKAAKAHQETVQ